MDKVIVKMGIDQIKDIDKPNEPFSIIGKIIPKYDGEKWTYDEVLYNKPSIKIYPKEDIDFNEYINNESKIIYICYIENECIGRIRINRSWNKYCQIEGIEVSSTVRGLGIGTELIKYAIDWAKSNDLKGLVLETQDNNLLACRFYKKCGFEIGSADTMLYKNFDNKDEKAIFWYMMF